MAGKVDRVGRGRAAGGEPALPELQFRERRGAGTGDRSGRWPTTEWDGSEMYQTYVGSRLIASGRPLPERGWRLRGKTWWFPVRRWIRWRPAASLALPDRHPSDDPDGFRPIGRGRGGPVSPDQTPAVRRGHSVPATGDHRPKHADDLPWNQWCGDARPAWHWGFGRPSPRRVCHWGRGGAPGLAVYLAGVASGWACRFRCSTASGVPVCRLARSVR